MLVTTLTIFFLFLFGVQANALSIERAESFVRAMAESGEQLA